MIFESIDESIDYSDGDTVTLAYKGFERGIDISSRTHHCRGYIATSQMQNDLQSNTPTHPNETGLMVKTIQA